METFTVVTACIDARAHTEDKDEPTRKLLRGIPNGESTTVVYFPPKHPYMCAAWQPLLADESADNQQSKQHARQRQSVAKLGKREAPNDAAAAHAKHATRALRTHVRTC